MLLIRAGSLRPTSPGFATLHQLRQLRDIGRDPAGFVAGEQVRRRATAGVLLEVVRRSRWRKSERLLDANFHTRFYLL